MQQQFNDKNNDIQIWVKDRLVPRSEAKVSVFDSAVQGGDVQGDVGPGQCARGAQERGVVGAGAQAAGNAEQVDHGRLRRPGAWPGRWG